MDPNIDRYLKVVCWARTRYTIDRILIISVGGFPSTFSRIEKLAADKYLFSRQ